MPTYNYKCKNCDERTVIFQKISDLPLVKCEKCDGELKRIISGGTGLIFKGDGFYLTDYARKDKKHTYEYIGCSVEYLRSHLETQFEKESERCGHSISWENQGDWHIDHIKPCDSFDLDLEDERHKCFHYTNLQPMWAPDNLSKSNIYDEYEDEREWNGDKWI